MTIGRIVAASIGYLAVAIFVIYAGICLVAGWTEDPRWRRFIADPYRNFWIASALAFGLALFTGWMTGI